MGLLTPNIPGWHPAPAKAKEAALGAVARCQELVGLAKGGLPSVAIGWAVEQAERGEGGEKMATVIGMSNLREVHQAVNAWREVKDGSKLYQQYAEEAIQAFTTMGMKDWSWS